jgi:hypothetical protein
MEGTEVRQASQAWRRWLSDCRQDADGWEGHAFIPGWRALLHLRLPTEAEAQPSLTQLRSLAELVSRRDDLRGRVKRRMFMYYKEEVQGAAGYYNPLSGEFRPDPDAPPIRRSADIWPLVGEPEVWVDDRP